MNSVANLLDILYEAHCKNARSAYYAKRSKTESHSTMPTTSFVYEFFVYNSIYQYDWETSLAENKLTPWARNVSDKADSSDDGDAGMSECKQQQKLDEFIRKRCKDNPSILMRAFEPLGELTDLDGKWTEVVADARISTEEGKHFFRRLTELADQVRAAWAGTALTPSGRLFDLIGNCRRFVYLVRNNIFHGSKPIDETSEPNQRRRIEVYDLFLKCLVSLFFLARGKEPVAADHLPFLIHLEVGDQCTIKLDQEGVIDFLGPRQGLGLKPEDTRLIQRLKRLGIERGCEITDRSTLFYPSAGRDVILPTLLGMRFCTHFYYYDESVYDERNRRDFAKRNKFFALQKLCGTRFDEPEQSDDELIFRFVCGGHDRFIHCVGRDNFDFLNRDVDLTFFFHRGDSWGEGGCGQEWDSKHLGQLIQKVQPKAECQIVTDGEPGGIHSGLTADLTRLHFPKKTTERGRDYYYGRLTGDALRSRLAQ